MKLTTRLLVAIELLKLALELTDGTAHPNYLFYLTDLTADNISVQLDKTSSSLISLKVIDWSDVIVVPYDQIMKTNDNCKLVSKVFNGLTKGSYASSNTLYNLLPIAQKYLQVKFLSQLS